MENEMVSYDRANELLVYDPALGTLTWKVGRSRMKAGDVAGSITRKGYVSLSIDSRQYMAHRIAWLLHYGEWPEKQIDHKNRIRHDNAINNLRLATNGQNSHYAQRKIPPSGYRGVHFSKSAKRWCAHIMSNGKTIHLGYFDEVEKAAEAYKLAALKYHGEFANVG